VKVRRRFMQIVLLTKDRGLYVDVPQFPSSARKLASTVDQLGENHA
jgi:hypothetical protein